MTEILSGKNVAEALNEKLKTEVSALESLGIAPTLMIVRVGEREDDIAYERGAMKRCESIGVHVKNTVLAQDVSEEELLAVIDGVNRDNHIHGCLLFRPLPKGIDETRVCNALSPEKDIDGISELSLAGVFSGTGRGFPPCTAKACMELLAYYGIDLAGKNVVVVGRSLVIGKPVSMMLMAENATVTVCHSRTKNLETVCRNADLLVVAAGRAGLVGADGIGTDAIVVDVGINVDNAGNLCGDVRQEDAEKARAYTPVPGGIGTVTTSVLAAHIIEAAKKSAKKRG